MSIDLRSFSVYGLRGERTIKITIEENKLIIVGENGTGKSTVVTLLYLFLTQQWRRLSEYDFLLINIMISGRDISISKDEILLYSEEENRAERLVSRFSPAALLRLKSTMADLNFEELRSDQAKIAELARQVGVPRITLTQYIATIEGTSNSDRLHETMKLLSDLVPDQVLFLPTYRRIEQDLHAILRGTSGEGGLNSERSSRSFLREVDVLREQFTHTTKGAHHVELVQFGMEDVEQTITEKMAKVKDNVRNGLNSLTGRYLREIISGEINDVDLSAIRDLDENKVDAIFERTGAILPPPEQQRLRVIIEEIKVGESIDDSKKIVAHFLTRMIELYETQQQQEKDVQEFARVCSEYLVGKRVLYNSSDFSISIQNDNSRHADNSEDSNIISLRNLSSGEKQVISLFSHIYLSGDERYFVILDEPEMSLSVPWQRRLLPDVLATNRCVGLIAVTHSPFIYDNELDGYAHALEEFTENYDDLS